MDGYVVMQWYKIHYAMSYARIFIAKAMEAEKIERSIKAIPFLSSTRAKVNSNRSTWFIWKEHQV